MIKKEARKFITEQAQKRLKLLGLDGVEVESDTDLVKEGIFDSLSFVDLVVECENRFGVEIDLERYSSGEFTRVDKLAEIIEEAKKAA